MKRRRVIHDLHWMNTYSLVGQTPVPCSFYVYALEVLPDIATRRVGLTRIGPFSVSTVFLGIDGSLGFGTPRLFETRTTYIGTLEGTDNNPCDGQWATWTEAEAAHRRAVDYLQRVCCEPGEQPVDI